MTDRIWELHEGSGPLAATAIHDGSDVRADVLRHMLLGEADRQREEDPYTSEWTRIAPTRVVGWRSRFEVDLNRPRAQAVYRTPADCWGLRVWHDSLPDDVAAQSLMEYDASFPASACVLAIEFKKFFMDEWTGEADRSLVAAIGNALKSTVPGVLEELAKS